MYWIPVWIPWLRYISLDIWRNIKRRHCSSVKIHRFSLSRMIDMHITFCFVLEWIVLPRGIRVSTTRRVTLHRAWPVKIQRFVMDEHEFHPWNLRIEGLRVNLHDMVIFRGAREGIPHTIHARTWMDGTLSVLWQSQCRSRTAESAAVIRFAEHSTSY